jgi:hypothetical protein
MERAGTLYAVLSDFADLALRPSVVSNEAIPAADRSAGVR